MDDALVVGGGQRLADLAGDAHGFVATASGPPRSPLARAISLFDQLHRKF